MSPVPDSTGDAGAKAFSGVGKPGHASNRGSGERPSCWEASLARGDWFDLPSLRDRADDDDDDAPGPASVPLSVPLKTAVRFGGKYRTNPR